jgi:hypothetical protein
MSLLAKLFRGDPALEACLLHDAAHVRSGAIGHHVSKIQTALAILDDAHINPAEIGSMRYGPSTAGAVLAYKKKRNIINYSYQAQADNIVGKMTIASLDSEMLIREGRRIPAYGCGDRLSGSGGQAASRIRPPAFVPARASKSVGAAVATGGTFPAKLDTVWQVTTGAAKKRANRHLRYLEKAIELLKPYQMAIISSVTSPPDTPFPYEMTIDPRNRSDIWSVRKAAASARSAPAGVLCIIVCEFESWASDYFGLTDAGTVDGVSFPAFTLLNVNVLRTDRCTVIHEMIHAADLRLTVKDHDADPDNVFSEGSTRSKLTPSYAEIISKGYFAK